MFYAPGGNWWRPRAAAHLHWLQQTDYPAFSAKQSSLKASQICWDKFVRAAEMSLAHVHAAKPDELVDRLINVAANKQTGLTALS